MTSSTRLLDQAEHVEVVDRDTWRRWLERNHATAAGVWLVWPRSTSRRGLDYNAAVEEALCFGWIDGQAAAVDLQRSRQYFAPRRAGSPWSSLNKERLERMLAGGRVAPAGVAAVERARSDGSWSVLDSVARMEVPAALTAALDARPPAMLHWRMFPPSAKRAHLAWIATARRDETRARRIAATAAAAQLGERALDRRDRR